MMTHEEAMKRNDYRFVGEYARHFRSDLIRSMQQSENEAYFEEHYGDAPQWGVAMLEIGYIDIELNITAFGAEYFICTKDADGEWDSTGYVTDLMMNIGFADAEHSSDWLPDVEFDADDWEWQLQQDMFRVLNNVIEVTRWDYDTPNSYNIRRK